MRRVVDLRQRLEVEVRVDLRGGDARVPQHFLHRAQVLRGLQHVSGEGVAQQVRMHRRIQPPRACPGAQPHLHCSRRDALAARAHEQRPLRRRGQLRALAQPFAQRLARASANRHGARLRAFAGDRDFGLAQVQAPVLRVQRDNRQRIRALAAGREVLDAFCYTGGFALSALAGSAKRVLALDSSAPALEVARENLDANALDASRIAFEQVDVFAQQRKLRDAGAKFDLVILDPPKFAPTAAQAKNAARAYKDINLLAFKLLAPGGLLATFSCSGGVSAELFQSIVAGAAADAGVGGRVIERFHGGADHPVALSFPEGDYLKGLLISL